MPPPPVEVKRAPVAFPPVDTLSVLNGKDVMQDLRNSLGDEWKANWEYRIARGERKAIERAQDGWKALARVGEIGVQGRDTLVGILMGREKLDA
jgi:hypothetical protein